MTKEKNAFFGVSEKSKAYKLCNLITKKIIISRDMFFNGEQFQTNDESKLEQLIILILMVKLKK